FNRTPLLEFLGKGNRFANLTGEKLSEHQVTQAMDAAAAEAGAHTPAGYSLAPCWDEAKPDYGLFAGRGGLSDESAIGLLGALDGKFRDQNSESDAKRDSGRLGPPRLLVLPPGTWLKWDQERLRRSGGAAEQYKHPCLIGDPEFRTGMPVE